MRQSHRKSFSLSIQSPSFLQFTSLHPHFFTLWGSRSESWSFEIERSRTFSRKSSFSVSNSRMQPLKPTATPVLWNLGKNIITFTCVISCINYLFQNQKLSYHYYSLSDVWCLLSNVRRLMSVVWCQTSNVWCLMSDVWCLVYDDWCLVPDAWCLKFVVWCQTSDVCLMSDVTRVMWEVWCMISDV